MTPSLEIFIRSLLPCANAAISIAQNLRTGDIYPDSPPPIPAHELLGYFVLDGIRVLGCLYMYTQNGPLSAGMFYSFFGVTATAIQRSNMLFYLYSHSTS